MARFLASPDQVCWLLHQRAGRISAAQTLAGGRGDGRLLGDLEARRRTVGHLGARARRPAGAAASAASPVSIFIAKSL